MNEIRKKLKIETEKDYEVNHALFETVSDEFLYDYFCSVEELYERVSAEIAFRIINKTKQKVEENEKRV